jgi:small multidrug resistance pump
MKSTLVAWSVLVASVVAEVAGTVALKHSSGFTKFLPAAIAGFFYVVAIWLMAIAMRQLEMGVTYAVWAGSGTAAIALVGIAFYEEQTSALKLAGLALVVFGVVLLNLEAQP